MLGSAMLFLVAIGLTSVSAQGLAFPTTLETVIRQNPTDISASRVVNPSADASNPGVILSAVVEDLNTITIIKTSYTGPWTKRSEEDSTALVNPGGPMIPASPTRDTIVASGTTRSLQPTACPQHTTICKVGEQPIFDMVNGNCECGPFPVRSPIIIIPTPTATPDLLNCPDMPVCEKGTLVWDQASGACSCT